MIKIHIKDLGTIVLELDRHNAPISAANFTELAKKGFYNGLTFHRVISGFMVQGGDPEGTGMGGPDYSIKGEFKENGVNNEIKHDRGVISMARSSLLDSAGSQFFIVHKNAHFLDGSYAAFGKVTEGLEVVDKIAAVATDANDKPKTAVIIESVEVIDEPDVEFTHLR